MKSPQEMATKLAAQWQNPDWRERQLLGGPTAWPLSLAIGVPSTHMFTHDAARLRQHLQQWRDVAQQGTGRVEWQARRYRGSSDAVDVPTHWVLDKPSDFFTAIRQLKAPGHTQIKADSERLGTLIHAIEPPGFRRLLVRRLAQWHKASTADLITAARMALQLAPGCAQGKPLRALAMAGNDSKFFERHANLLTLLLDERFDGEASRQGLVNFLGGLQEGDHWLLVVPMAAGLLPFARQRVTAKELQHTPLPAQRILLVENESSLHQLPMPLPGTIAVLGSGLDLQWLGAAWLQGKQVAYWGDLDTWGMAMLATARQQLPQLQALLMDRATFDAHLPQAVPEQVPADAALYATLPPQELALAHHLRTQAKGRLEQEFLPAERVANTIHQWLQHTP